MVSISRKILSGSGSRGREGGRGGGGEEEEKEGQGGEYLEGKKSSKLVCSAQQPAGGTKGE